MNHDMKRQFIMEHRINELVARVLDGPAKHHEAEIMDDGELTEQDLECVSGGGAQTTSKSWRCVPWTINGCVY